MSMSGRGQNSRGCAFVQAAHPQLAAPTYIRPETRRRDMFCFTLSRDAHIREWQSWISWSRCRCPRCPRLRLHEPATPTKTGVLGSRPPEVALLRLGRVLARRFGLVGASVPASVPSQECRDASWHSLNDMTGMLNYAGWQGPPGMLALRPGDVRQTF